MSKRRDPATIVASAGTRADTQRGGLTPPIWASDTFAWPDPDTKPAYDYARTASPNRDILSAALAELEGAAGGVVTGAGQAASLLALLLVPAGGLVVAPHDCYGGTYRLIRGLDDAGKLEALFIDQKDDAAFAAAMARKPFLVWIETPSNPLLRLVDIAVRAAEARAAGALILADNTLPTPLRQQPIALGCDLVVHSTTKALNGHSDLVGGAILAADPALVERLDWWANAAGLSGPAFDAWQTLRGMRTLALRVDRAETTALAIAEWLAARRGVSQVFYPGLSSHPDYALAHRQQSGPGSVLSVRLDGGEAASAAFLAALETITLAASLGSYATLICRPSTMTHRGMPPEAQTEAGDHAGSAAPRGRARSRRRPDRRPRTRLRRDRPPLEKRSEPTMDDKDLRILALLQEDASITVAEISARVHLSQTPCWRRIQKLEESGVIERRVAILDPNAVGFPLTVFVEVQAFDHSSEWLDRFERVVFEMPEVMEIHRMAGEIDFLLRVAARDMDAYDEFYRRFIEAVPMKNVTSRFAMERVKATTAYPIAKREPEIENRVDTVMPKRADAQPERAR